MLLKTEFSEGILVGKIRILYFLEDRAQDGLIKALIERIAKEESIPVDDLIHDIRSARHGSRVFIEFKNFLRDISKSNFFTDVLLVVAIDGNCKGYYDRIKQLEKMIKPDHPLRNKVIYAVPDPHIERWYMMDQKAFKAGVGLKKAPDLAPYKCKKDYYKQLLHQALKESNISSLLGGAEYGERIVNQIEEMEKFSRVDTGCQVFVQSLKIFFRNVAFSS